LDITTRLVARTGGPDVYGYRRIPGVPPVTVMRVEAGSLDEVEEGHSHVHDFPLLAYFERGGGSLRLGGRDWRVNDGDAYLVAPGEVLGAGRDPRGLRTAEGWTAFFAPEVLGSEAPGAFLSWRAHPLLLPFVRGRAGGTQRLVVPGPARPVWTARFSALDLELRARRDGYRDAALAHLTLLLVDVARLAADVVGGLRLRDEPLLADVFNIIEERFHEPISLRDVARAVSLSPGYLTTVVRRKTGRTVQEWIVERRLAQARRLLVETDLAVEEVGRRVGYVDPSYFVRIFRRAHDVTPLAWRRAGRS
jgi:AraC family transcriptional regulator, transcriptional activator of pobA